MGKDKAFQKMGPLRFSLAVLRLMSPYKTRLFVLFVAVLVQVAFFAVLPLFYREIFDRVLSGKDWQYLGHLSLLLPALLVFEILGEIVDSAQMSRLVADSMRDMRRHVYAHLQQLPISFYTRTPPGDLLSRFTNDLVVLERGLSGPFYRLIFHSTALVAIVALMFHFDVRLALMALLALPLALLGPKLLGGEALRLGGEYSTENARVVDALQESMSAQKVIRTLALQIVHLERFTAQLGILHGRGRAAARATNFLDKSSSSAVLVIQLLVMVGGGYLATEEQLTAGTLVAFWALLAIMGNSLRELAGTSTELVQAATAMQEVDHLLRQPLEFSVDRQTVDLPEFSQQIRFENVQFSYLGESNDLEDLSLEIAAGESVAFIGHSGSGKTTLGNLLLRLYEPNSGKITIDGIDLSEVAEESLRWRPPPLPPLLTILCSRCRRDMIHR